MPLTRRELMKAALAAGAITSTSAAELPMNSGGPVRSSQYRSGWKPRQLAKKPNIVFAVLDDIGFSDLGCFGSEIETPCVDALASNGVRFNNFHVTALCAPTRACLMTGQNAHRVGVGNIAEWGRPLPGYRGYIREDVTLLPEMLKDANYNTIAVGKWHLSMVNDQDAMGPFDHWPTGRGFDHWYGFHGSAVDHFYPELFRNQSQVYPQTGGDYHLTTDLVDQAMFYVREHQTATPSNPFFLYLGLGACHFPFHAPDAYLQKYRGRFSAGYDALRQPRFERQQGLGVVPDNTILTPRPDDIAKWSELTNEEQAFSERTMEAFAGMLNHADEQLQRFIDNLAAIGELDNTIIVVMSDNGAGGGYHRAGALDVRRIAYIEPESVAHKFSALEDVGTMRSSPLYSTGWSFLGNTPLKRRKGDTYAGGTRTPLIVHWPDGALNAGGINGQYHHVTDLVPSVLEMANLDVELAEPLDGRSLAYTFDEPDAATTKRVQHFETAGDRAIWKKGWKAVTLHEQGDEFSDDVWALYNADSDFSEALDRSKDEPERLLELVAVWEQEARANKVLPLDDDLDGLYAKVAPKPRPRYVFYPGQTRFNRLTAPDIYHYDFSIAASVDLSAPDSNGVILASGDSAAGYELFMRDGSVHFVYVYTREAMTRLKSTHPVPAGTREIRLLGKSNGQGSAKLTLYFDDTPAGSIQLPKMWKVEALNAGIRCGENSGAPISFDYAGRFPFDQVLHHVDVDLRI